MDAPFGRRHRLDRRTLIARSGQAAGLAALAGVAPLGRRGTPVTRAALQGDNLAGQLVIATTASTFPGDSARAITEAYRSRRPNVELTWELQDLQASDYATWLGTQLAAGEIRPDIVTGVYQKTFRDWLNYAEYRYAPNPHTGRPWDEDLDWGRAQEYTPTGSLIGVPTAVYSIVWFYNKGLFATAGAEPPTTWAEFVEVCAKLDRAEITPVVANFDWQVPQWLAEVYTDQYLIDWVETVRAQPEDWNYNPDLDPSFAFDAADPNIHLKYTFSPQRFLQGLRDGALRYDTPEIAEFVRNMAQVFPRYATEDFFVVQDPYPTFLQQQAAIMPGDTGNLITLRSDMAALGPERLEELGIEAADAPAFEWGTFLMPPMEGPLVKSPVRSIEGSAASPSIVVKDQRQAELALDFIMFYISEAGYQPYLDALVASGDYYPGGPVTITGVELPAEIQEAFRGITLVGDAEASYNSWFLNWGGADLRMDALGLYQEALEGRATPEEFAGGIQALVTENFDAILEEAGLTHADLDNPARRPGS